MDRDEYFRNLGYEQGFRSGYRIGGLVMAMAMLGCLGIGLLLLLYRWGAPWTCA
jgi:hypothetical protein